MAFSGLGLRLTLAFLAAPSTDMNSTFTGLSPTLLDHQLSSTASRRCKKRAVSLGNHIDFCGKNGATWLECNRENPAMRPGNMKVWTQLPKKCVHPSLQTAEPAEELSGRRQRLKVEQFSHSLLDKLIVLKLEKRPFYLVFCISQWPVVEAQGRIHMIIPWIHCLFAAQELHDPLWFPRNLSKWLWASSGRKGKLFLAGRRRQWYYYYY